MSKLTIIIGGIRSGKSCFGEKKALEYSEKPYYIATSIPFDEEMKERVNIHKKRREDRFITIEESMNINVRLSELKDQTVLIDCLTLNLSNRLMKDEDRELEFHIEKGDLYLEEMVDIIKNNNLRVYIISNEVGYSPVLVNKLGRYFQDLQGRWNCFLSDRANEVYLVESGIPRLIKKESCAKFKLGAPSYVIPGNYLENVMYLNNKVSDVQLLLFESLSDDPLFDSETIFTLNYLKNGSNFSYSAHMPTTPMIWENINLKKRESEKIIMKLSELGVKDYTFHYDLPDYSESNYDKVKEKTDLLYIEFFTYLRLKYPDLNFNLENIKTPITALDNVVEKSGITYCADIGHYLLNNYNLCEIYERINKTTIIHIHGLADIIKHNNERHTKDHEAVKGSPELFRILDKFNGLVTIENYHPNNLEKSMKVISDYF